MNCSAARFGLGGELNDAAEAGLTSPTPDAKAGPFGTGLAVSIRAPLIWSGVQLGCRASSWAAAPATTGAANEVPESCMYPGATMWSGRCSASVELVGTGPIM